MIKILGIYTGEGALGDMCRVFLGPWHSGYHPLGSTLTPWDALRDMPSPYTFNFTQKNSKMFWKFFGGHGILKNRIIILTVNC
jgi:hypothetical protein